MISKRIPLDMWHNLYAYLEGNKITFVHEDTYEDEGYNPDYSVSMTLEQLKTLLEDLTK